MKTFTLTDLNKALSTASFVIEPDFFNNLSESDFVGTEIDEENIDSKFYPKFISAQKIDIAGISLTVTKTIQIAVFISLDKSTNKVSGYIDEDHFYSLANHEVTFEGDNIAITSDDGEILTLPSAKANNFIFNEYINDYDVSLNLPELTTEAASNTLDELLANSENATYLKKQMEKLA